MDSNQLQSPDPSQTPENQDKPASGKSTWRTNRLFMVVTGIIAACAVLGLLWACLAFFRYI